MSSHTPNILRAAQRRLAVDLPQRVEIRLGLNEEGRAEARALRPGAPAWPGILPLWPTGFGAPSPHALLIEAEPLASAVPARVRALAARPGLYVKGHLFALTVLWLPEGDGDAVRVLGPDGPLELPVPPPANALPPLSLWPAEAGWWDLPTVGELAP